MNSFLNVGIWTEIPALGRMDDRDLKDTIKAYRNRFELGKIHSIVKAHLEFKWSLIILYLKYRVQLEMNFFVLII